LFLLLKVAYGNLLSTFALNFNWRHYNEDAGGVASNASFVEFAHNNGVKDADILDAALDTVLECHGEDAIKQRHQPQLSPSPVSAHHTSK
jgi:hypothetical protein